MLSSAQPDVIKKCASDEEIGYVLKQLMFTAFYVKEDAVLGFKEYLNRRPVLSQDAFHS